MRDSFAQADHFSSYITDLEKAEKTTLGRLEEGTLKERKPGKTRWLLWRNRLDILECRYSLGLPISDLRTDFDELVDVLPSLEAFDSSSATGFDICVTLASWSVLLDDSKAAETVAAVAERDGSYKHRLVPLLGYFGLHPSKVEPEEPLSDYGVYEARDAQLAGDLAAASDLLYKFVNEQWFQRTYNSGFRPLTHTGAQAGHVGYWCYEGAAFAKAFGIDDSHLEEHKYYPWDLLHK